jgi:GDPmannose 4,6-dehydratase
MDSTTQCPNKVALITTTTGQDAFFLSRKLKSLGYRVIGLSGGSGIPHATFDTVLPFSFVETNRIFDFLNKNQVNEIYNLAAKSSVADSWHNKELYFETNFHSLKRILDALISSSLRNEIKFLQVGSTDMLGLTYIDQPLKPNKSWSPYGESKLQSHFEALKARDSGLFCSSIVVTNHDSSLRSSRFVIPKLAQQICDVIQRNTSSVHLQNWNTTRDWAHAEDCTFAMYLSLQLSEPEELLIGTGVSMSLRDLAEAIRVQYDLKFQIKSESISGRENDLEKIFLDVTKTKKILNWNPQRTGPGTIFSIIEDYLSR